jgi:hypothetical protein
MSKYIPWIIGGALVYLLISKSGSNQTFKGKVTPSNNPNIPGGYGLAGTRRLRFLPQHMNA